MKFNNCLIAIRRTPVGAWSQISGNAAGAVTAWSEPRFLLTSHTIFSCCATVTSPSLFAHRLMNARPPWRLCVAYSEHRQPQDRPGKSARQRKRASAAEHFMACPNCGAPIDMRDLGQVLEPDTPLHIEQGRLKKKAAIKAARSAKSVRSRMRA